MAYASADDMVERFGEPEMIRLTTPEGADLAGIVADRAARALLDASDLADTYLRRRYAVPLPAAPDALTRAVCAIARYDLAFGSTVTPTEQMRLARREAIEWLDGLARGTLSLDGLAPAVAEQPNARVQDRCPAFRAGDRLIG